MNSVVFVNSDEIFDSMINDLDTLINLKPNKTLINNVIESTNQACKKVNDDLVKSKEESLKTLNSLLTIDKQNEISPNNLNSYENLKNSLEKTSYTIKSVENVRNNLQNVKDCYIINSIDNKIEFNSYIYFNSLLFNNTEIFWDKSKSSEFKIKNDRTISLNSTVCKNTVYLNKLYSKKSKTNFTITFTVDFNEFNSGIDSNLFFGAYLTNHDLNCACVCNSNDHRYTVVSSKGRVISSKINSIVDFYLDRKVNLVTINFNNDKLFFSKNNEEIIGGFGGYEIPLTKKNSNFRIGIGYCSNAKNIDITILSYKEY